MKKCNKKKLIDPKALQGNKKVTLTNVPLTLLPLMAKPMNDGKDKYGKYNWLECKDGKLDNLTYINAALRHMLLYLAGQDVTSDSGAHHLDAVVAGLSILRDAEMFDKVTDSRIKLSNDNLEKYERLINQELGT